MKSVLFNILLWVVAFVLTVGIVIYQKKTGPTYPVKGTVQLGEVSIDYNLKRTHELAPGSEDHVVTIDVSDTEVTGAVFWKRYNVNEATIRVEMTREGNTLKAVLPQQPWAGKLSYQLFLSRRGSQVFVPEFPVIIRFKGFVPRSILIPHIFFMFIGFIVAMRTALGALFRRKVRTLTFVTLGLILIGGMVLGPIVQKFAFGAYWTGWPFGGDWTDNKTIAMILGWVVAAIVLWKKEAEERRRWWTILAMVIMFAVYMIPHSMGGSELNYESGKIGSAEVGGKVEK